ncbi:hypothetical protein [Pontibacter populi]|uniref:O-antigen ligase domain-containing protein n=1 Tax=Pontibacter populi TaxID=890055 RepID=A0ABV1RXY3_9BACT
MKQGYINFILVFLLLALSTSPFFKQSIGFYLALISVIIFFKPVIRLEAIVFLLLVFMLEQYHYFYFSNYEPWVIRQVLFYFFVAIFTIYYVKLSFLEIYNRILYVAAIISLIVYSLYIIYPGIVISFVNAIPSFFTKYKEIYETNYKIVNPVFYNFDFNFFKGRNNGPFWEPTVFASLLIIAQIFNFLLTKKLFNKKGIVYSITILTTLSTTGYFVYFILVLSYFLLTNKINIFFKLAAGVLLLYTGFYLFNNVPFLKEKINNELASVDTEIEEKGGNSRVASATLDLKEVTAKNIYLLLGKGSSKYSRIGTTNKNVLRNCGITSLLAEWGLPFFILYLSLLFYSFYQLTKLFQVNRVMSIVFTSIILMLSFSEVFFSLPLFHAFIFIGFIVKREYRSLVITKEFITIPPEPLEEYDLKKLKGISTG